MSPELLPALRDGGERIALRFPGRSLTYRELERESYGVAMSLLGRSRVAVLAEPRIETAVAVVGVVRAGAAAVLIDPRSGVSELAHVVADAAPRALLVAAGTEVPGPLRGLEAIAVDAIDRVRVPGFGLGAVDETPALIVSTSGTTGPPKSAVLPGRALASNLDALAEIWSWSGDDVVVHGLPLFHVHGLVLGILGPLRRGGTAVHTGRFSPEAIGTALGDGATMVFGVPTMYRRLAEAAAEDPSLAGALAGARLLVSGSAALPAAEHARLRELTGRGVVERYGMTETLMIAGMGSAGGEAGTVGPSLPGVEVALRGDAGEEISAPDEIGEVLVRGPNLFLGYRRRPPLAPGEWFATGDMAVWARGGALRLVGRRATDLIKTGGHKVGAGEVEAALREHPSVADAAVTGEPDDDLGERIVAWVVLREGRPVDADELAAHVAGLLTPHKRPREVRFLADLPRNALGKVQKRRLSSRSS